MTMSFSQRNGFTKAKDLIQVESMDDDLRIGLWNMLALYLWDRFSEDIANDRGTHSYCLNLWINFFKYPLDGMFLDWSKARSFIRSKFFQEEWFWVYDFLEFSINHYPFGDEENFINKCNQVLIKEVSAYRFVEKHITKIVSEEEIESIEQSISNSSTNIQEHLKTALSHLSNRHKPDYRNSIKESISAVEAICKQIAENDKATLGKALDQIERLRKIKLHSSLKEAFDKLYGYTNSADGIRHALLDEDTLDFEDAKFMLVVSSAFINYLIVKSKKIV